MPQNSWFHFLQRRKFILKLKLGWKRNKVGWKLPKETPESLFYISSFPKVCLTLSPPCWESLGFWLPDVRPLQHPSPPPTLLAPAEARGWASLASGLMFSHTLSGFVSALSFSDSRHDSITSRYRKAVSSRALGVRGAFHLPAWKCPPRAAPGLHGPGRHTRPQERVPVIPHARWPWFSMIRAWRFPCRLRTFMGCEGWGWRPWRLPLTGSLPPVPSSSPGFLRDVHQVLIFSSEISDKMDESFSKAKLTLPNLFKKLDKVKWK